MRHKTNSLCDQVYCSSPLVSSSVGSKPEGDDEACSVAQWGRRLGESSWLPWVWFPEGGVARVEGQTGCSQE